MAKSKRKPGGGGGSGGTAVNDEFRQTIAARLLDGAEPDVLARQLSSAGGIALGIVEAEIARAEKSPYLHAARTAADQLKWRIGKWEWVMQNGARLAANDPAALDVPVLDAPDPQVFYRDHYRAHRPVLMRGLFDHWPARKIWSLDHVASRVGDREVRVQWNREADANYEGRAGAHGTFRPFAEIVGRLRSTKPSNDFYITANNADANREAFAPLFDEIGPMPGMLRPGGERNGFVWIGPYGTITPWHHDLTNNLLIQIVGRKRVRMVASHDAPLMRNERHCFSSWGTNDLTPGPALGDKPTVLECTIGPGDALFLPVGWWHHVEGLDQTIGMSFTEFAWDNDFYSSYHSH